jgi:SAM-dependent methyltransferase
MSSSATQTAANRYRFLAEAVAWRYRPQGFAVRRYVQEKLLRDPFYRGLFSAGRLPAEGVVLDLGCGRGIFLSLVASAQAQGLIGGGKRGVSARLVGIEINQNMAESARAALGDKAEIIQADLSSVVLPACRMAVLQDVLLGLSPEEQDKLLERAVAAVEAGGMLVLREIDAGKFWLSTGIKWVNGVASLFRRGEKQRFYPRSEAEWQQRLEALGLHIEKLPAGPGRVFLLAYKPGQRPA